MRTVRGGSVIVVQRSTEINQQREVVPRISEGCYGSSDTDQISSDPTLTSRVAQENPQNRGLNNVIKLSTGIENMRPAQRAEVENLMLKIMFDLKGEAPDLADISDDFGSLIEMAINHGPIDINALVQQVLRESYLENTEDLKMHADKVRFFNECKKTIRDKLGKARDVKAKNAGKKDEDALAPPYNFTDPNTDYSSSPVDATSATEATDQLSGGGVREATSAELQAAGVTDLGEAFITEPGGYIITTDVPVGTTTKFFEKGEPGSDPLYTLMTQVRGDPHVDQDGDGTNDWHFGEDSSFTLPDGTKISFTTEGRTEEDRNNNILVTTGIDIQSGTKRAHVGHDKDTLATTATTITDDRKEWDESHADSGGTGSHSFYKVEGGWAVPGADGKFYRVPDETWADYTSNPDFDLTGCEAVEVSAEQVKAGAIEKTVGSGSCTTVAQLDAHIEKLEAKLNSVGDDAQLANVDLQNVLQKQQQNMQMMSNISKMLHDTAMAIVRKIG